MPWRETLNRAARLARARGIVLNHAEDQGPGRARTVAVANQRQPPNPPATDALCRLLEYLDPINLKA